MIWLVASALVVSLATTIWSFLMAGENSALGKPWQTWYWGGCLNYIVSILAAGYLFTEGK